MRFFKSGKKTNKSDVDLIAEYKQTPNPDIIEIFFDRYSHLVFAVSYNYLKSEEESKDAVLYIFEKLPHDLGAYEIRNFSSWLHSVTKNYCIRLLSKIKTIPTEVSKLEDHSLEDEEGFEKEFLPYLSVAIERLKEEQRTCIELFYLKKFSYQQVCEETNFSMNEVKSYIQNGKRNLKIILLKIRDERS